MMEWYWAFAILLGTLFALMLLSVPVAFAFLGVNVVGAWLFMGGEIGLGQLVRNSIQSVNSFSLTPIPLFVLMGEVLFHTGVAYRAINAVERLIARVPGRLSIVSVLGGTVFATLSGSSIANTAIQDSLVSSWIKMTCIHPSHVYCDVNCDEPFRCAAFLATLLQCKPRVFFNLIQFN